MLVQTQSLGYFCPQRNPRPPLKTSDTHFTWRQRLNEHGSTHVNKCHISFAFATVLPPSQKRRLALDLEKYTFLLPKLASVTTRPMLAHTRQPYEAVDCVITQLDNIIVEQRDHRSTTWAGRAVYAYRFLLLHSISQHCLWPLWRFPAKQNWMKTLHQDRDVIWMLSWFCSASHSWMFSFYVWTLQQVLWICP